MPPPCPCNNWVMSHITVPCFLCGFWTSTLTSSFLHSEHFTDRATVFVPSVLGTVIITDFYSHISHHDRSPAAHPDVSYRHAFWSARETLDPKRLNFLGNYTKQYVPENYLSLLINVKICTVKTTSLTRPCWEQNRIHTSCLSETQVRLGWESGPPV